VSTVETILALRYPDPDGRLAAVRLVSDLLKRDPPGEFSRAGSGADWELRVPAPPVDRIEYQLELEHPSGRVERVCDPSVPSTPGPFGPRSVLELPGYETPPWLDDDEAPAGAVEPLALRSRLLRADVHGRLWSAAETERDEPLPLLVVHDGPEYADYSGLLRLLDSAVAERELPPLRAALLAPVEGQRDEHYSASARYADALERELLPALVERAPAPAGREHRVGLGASLGALALLHAHRVRPGTFGGLLLQSGSYFRARSDAHERGFPRFQRIARFVGTVLRAKEWPDAVPVTITCGTVEENLANNRAVYAALAAQGYAVDMREVRDAHNWVAWRDTLYPDLVTLLQRVWG
jgi:enterochelin esterase family protein